MKIALLYSELRALLAPVIPHACTDDMLPSLCQIPIATSGDYLVAQATDRFTAAFKRVKPETKPPAQFALRLHAPDAKRVLNLLRPERGTNPEVVIVVEESGEIMVSSRSAGFALGFAGLDLELFSAIDQVYPNMAGLLPKPDDLNQALSSGTFSIPFMSRFKAAIDAEYDRYEARHAGVQIQLGNAANKPLIVTVGEDFVGLIMPKHGAAHTAAEVLGTWQGTVPVNGIRKPGSKPLSGNEAKAS